MERKYRGKLWGILSILAGVGLLAVLYFSTQSDAQFLRQATPLHKFIQATELYKKAEYEKAKTLFDEVNAPANIKSLTKSQQNDLRIWMEFNDRALVGRQRFEDVLVIAEKAVKEGRKEDVQRCVRELDANPYPSERQRQRLREIKCWLNGCASPRITRNS